MAYGVFMFCHFAAVDYLLSRLKKVRNLVEIFEVWRIRKTFSSALM